MKVHKALGVVIEFSFIGTGSGNSFTLKLAE
jgi:hypothetical protein